MNSPDDIVLTEHHDVAWTHDALDHAMANLDAYGFSGSAEERAFVAEERRRIDAGEPTRRNPAGSRVYLIESAGVVRGEVVVSNLGGTPEVDVAVYRRYEGAGLASMALSRVVEALHKEGHAKVRARIRLKNPEIDRVRRLLVRCGFARQNALGGTEEWHHRAAERTPQDEG